MHIYVNRIGTKIPIQFPLILFYLTLYPGYFLLKFKKITFYMFKYPMVEEVEEVTAL